MGRDMMLMRYPNKPIIPLMIGSLLGFWFSVSLADTPSEETSSTETPPPKIETSTDNALDDIVFVPHDFGAPEVTDAGAVRGSSAVKIQLFAPPTLSKTLSTTPSFYWYVDQAVDKPRFTLTKETAVEPLLEVTLEPVGQAGVYSLALSAHDVVLENPGLYRWSVSADGNDDAPAAEIVAQTMFLFEEDQGSPSTKTSAAEESARYFADNGYWYDLMDLVSRQANSANAGSGAWEALRADLLEQAGLAAGLLD